MQSARFCILGKESSFGVFFANVAGVSGEILV